MSAGEEFDVGDLFPASTKQDQPRRSLEVEWAPVGHVGLALATAAGVAAGLDVSGLDLPVPVVVGAAAAALAGSFAIWWRWGPIWAVVATFLLVTFAAVLPFLLVTFAAVLPFLVSFAPAAIAVLALTTVVVRSVRRNGTEGSL